jgi:hypothetical protein
VGYLDSAALVGGLHLRWKIAKLKSKAESKADIPRLNQ